MSISIKPILSSVLIPLLYALIFCASCDSRKSRNKTTSSSREPSEINDSYQKDTILPEGDPSFVTDGEIMSDHGPRSITRGVLMDKNGNMWFASWNGIIKYENKQFTNYTLKNGLRRFHVFSVYEDRSANLWFGMIGGGVYMYDGRTFTNFTTADGLVSNTVFCIYEDKSGIIWIGTKDGLSRYDSKAKSGKRFTTIKKFDGLNVNSIFEDKSGTIWFGTGGGVVCFDGKSYTDFTNSNGKIIANVRSIAEGKKGIIWIGSQDGLFRYDTGKGSGSLKKLSSEVTGTVYEDKGGTLWLTKIENNKPGISLSKYNGKTFTTITTQDQVFGITEDRNGLIWFGSAYGVWKYDYALNGDEAFENL